MAVFDVDFEGDGEGLAEFHLFGDQFGEFFGIVAAGFEKEDRKSVV